MKFAGIDEAGLGPILGPFCVGSCVIQAPDSDSLHSWTAELEAQPSRSKQRVVVNDSKKVFSQARGIEVLERTVLSFTRFVRGTIPQTIRDFFSAVGIVVSPELLQLPWYHNLLCQALPHAATQTDIEYCYQHLQERANNLAITLHKVKVGIAFEPTFNIWLDETGNKATACRKVLDPHFEQFSWGNPLQLTVDQQGGRRFYSDWLSELYPSELVMISEEGKGLSSYKIGQGTISFKCKADATHFEVALSSLFAKYAREIVMDVFNRYWSEQIPGIKPTAGYPQDGKHFVADITAAGKLPKNTEVLIRKK